MAIRIWRPWQQKWTFKFSFEMELIDSRVAHGILWRIPPLVLLISFLVPSMGVMLDHHFPERDPYHSHLTHVAKHTHIGSVEHTHPKSDIPLPPTVGFVTKDLGMGPAGMHIDLLKTEHLVPRAPLELVNLSISSIAFYKDATSIVEIPPPIL